MRRRRVGRVWGTPAQIKEHSRRHPALAIHGNCLRTHGPRRLSQPGRSRRSPRSSPLCTVATSERASASQPDQHCAHRGCLRPRPSATAVAPNARVHPAVPPGFLRYRSLVLADRLRSMRAHPAKPLVRRAHYLAPPCCPQLCTPVLRPSAGLSMHVGVHPSNTPFRPWPDVSPPDTCYVSAHRASSAGLPAMCAVRRHRVLSTTHPLISQPPRLLSHINHHPGERILSRAPTPRTICPGQEIASKSGFLCVLAHPPLPPALSPANRARTARIHLPTTTHVCGHNHPGEFVIRPFGRSESPRSDSSAISPSSRPLSLRFRHSWNTLNDSHQRAHPQCDPGRLRNRSQARFPLRSRRPPPRPGSPARASSRIGAKPTLNANRSRTAHVRPGFAPTGRASKLAPRAGLRDRVATEVANLAIRAIAASLNRLSMPQKA